MDDLKSIRHYKAAASDIVTLSRSLHSTGNCLDFDGDLTAAVKSLRAHRKEINDLLKRCETGGAA